MLRTFSTGMILLLLVTSTAVRGAAGMLSVESRETRPWAPDPSKC